MERIGGFELISEEEMDKIAEKVPKKRELKYKITKNHFLIFVKNPKGKWIERYHISRIRCNSSHEQIDS